MAVARAHGGGGGAAGGSGVGRAVVGGGGWLTSEARVVGGVVSDLCRNARYRNSRACAN